MCVYARLTAEYQGHPAYWPASIVEATDVTEPTKLRKRAHPGLFTVPGGAVPDYDEAISISVTCSDSPT